MTALQVLHLTGQSDPRRCALSPAQDAFLDELPVPESAKVRLNFPYDATSPAHRDTPLLLASLRHAVLFLRVRLLRRAWARRHRPAVEAQLRSADRTLVIAGSIGLDLLGRLDLPADVLARLTVVSYGAVAARAPRCTVVRVASRSDPLARWWGHDVEVDAGHLGYLAAPGLAALCRDLCQDLLAGPREGR